MKQHVQCPACDHQFPLSADASQPTSVLDHDFDDSSVDGRQTAFKDKVQERHARTRATALRWTTLAVMLLASTSAVFVFSQWRSGQDPDRMGPAGTNGKTVQRDDSRRLRPLLKGQYSDLLETIEQAVVEIECGGPEGVNSVGAGCVISADGLIATNYHVVADATLGQVRFKNGAIYEIAGYAAVSKADDLAILQLRDAPTRLTPLPLHEGDPESQTKVIAVGHPSGVSFSMFDGRVSQLVTTDRLSDKSRRFLRQQLPAESNHVWIQHTAVLSEGNSGGPLLDFQGTLLGINTWVDDETEFGYALHVSYLAELMQNRFESTVPLEEHASPNAKLAAAVQKLSPEYVQQLYDEASRMDWAPADRIQYRTLQQLARALTVARFRSFIGGANTISPEMLSQVIEAADRIEAKLETAKSRIEAKQDVINQFAAAEMRKPGSGVMAIATVEHIFDGYRGQSGMMMTLDGEPGARLFVPLTELIVAAEAGDRFLVIGINRHGDLVRFGDNPLKLQSAPIIFSRTLLPLDE